MRRLVMCTIGGLVLAGGTACAQDTGDVSGGYRFIRSEGVNFGAGWYADLTGHVTDMVSIVGDIGGSYKSESETEPITGTTISANVTLQTFAGGVKVRASTMNPKVVPFGHVLFGVAHSAADASGGGITVEGSATDPLLNLGGGVDIAGGANVGLRVRAGYVRVFSEGEGLNAFQLSIGGTIGL